MIMGWAFQKTWRGKGEYPMSMTTIQCPNHMYLGLSNWNDALPEGHSDAGEVTLRFHATKRPNSPAEVTLTATQDLPFAHGPRADFYMHTPGEVEMWFDLEPLRTHFLSRPAESETELKSLSLLMDGMDWFEAPKCMLAESWAFYAARMPYQDPDQMEVRTAVMPPKAEQRRKRREARKNN